MIVAGSIIGYVFVGLIIGSILAVLVKRNDPYDDEAAGVLFAVGGLLWPLSLVVLFGILVYRIVERRFMPCIDRTLSKLGL